MRIAITTPTGNIGRELTKRLLDQRGHELILLARTPDKLTKEQARGAKVVIPDPFSDGVGGRARVRRACGALQLYISGNCRSPRRRTMLWPSIFFNRTSSAVISGSPRSSARAT